MRIVMTAAEAVPFAKTGGLADVVSALSRELEAAGHQVWLIVPHYPHLKAELRGFTPPVERTEQTLRIRVGAKAVAGQVLKSWLPNSRVTVFLVDQAEYFGREHLYHERGQDYADNCERFTFFSRAVHEIIEFNHLSPDIIHAHDWQTALVPALLKLERQQKTGFQRARSVFTMHNVAFQGKFRQFGEGGNHWK